MTESPLFTAALEDLSTVGLNIFASIKVSRLPKDLFDSLDQFDVPDLGEQTLCLIGHGGKTLWTQLPRPIDRRRHPVDQFTLKAVERFRAEVMAETQLTVLYPHAEKIFPLQKMGRFLDLAHQSLLGIDIHAEFGPWFAYRCAFLTSAVIPEVQPGAFTPPCQSCAAKPCQSACPAKAVQQSGAEFKLSACVDYRLVQDSKCTDQCLARSACPVGEQHHYTLEQIQYHMGKKGTFHKLS